VKGEEIRSEGGVMAQEKCPRCGAPLAPGAAICVNCGLHLASGQSYQTWVEAPRDDEIGGGPPAPLRLAAEYFPGLFRPVVLLLSVVAVLVAAAVAWLSLFVFMMGAVLSAFPIGAVAVIAWGQAVAWMLHGHLSMLAECLSEFDSSKWTLFLVIFLAPFVSGFLLMRMAT
jgi:hypothetical protein